jgi:hypothetical protein
VGAQPAGEATVAAQGAFHLVEDALLVLGKSADGHALSFRAAGPSLLQGDVRRGK